MAAALWQPQNHEAQTKYIDDASASVTEIVEGDSITAAP
jgi:hypothetical protein